MAASPIREGETLRQYLDEEIEREPELRDLRDQHIALSQQINETKTTVASKERTFKDLTFLDDSTLSTVRRVGSFVAKNKVILLEVPFSIVIRAAAGAAFGAGVGCIVGLVYTPAAPVAIPAGAILGGAFGAVWGIKIALPPIKVRYEENFKNMKDRLYATPGMKLLLDDVPALRAFKCPLTQRLIVVAVKDNFGDTYEQVAIAEWIQEHPEGNNSPLQRGHIVRLELDIRYFSSLTKTFKRVASEKKQESQRILNEYLTRVRPIRDNLLDEIGAVAFRVCRERKLGTEETARNIAEIREKLELGLI